MTEKIFDMAAAAQPFLLCIMLLIAFATIIAVIVSFVVYIAYTLRERLRARRRRKAPWRQDGLYAEMDDCELGDVRWRRADGRIEVEYVIVNWLPGPHAYRNDRICVFQRGIGLEEDGDRVSRVLLKGAEVRFVQTFLARDGSTPIIQIDPSYTG